MESNIKGLVAAGHEMASELKAECGAVDMRSVAKLISDLATQLEVQLVRANALAAENAGLKSGAPSVSASPTLYCSFCNKSQHTVKKLIAGDNVFICNECVKDCNNIIQEEQRESA